MLSLPSASHSIRPIAVNHLQALVSLQDSGRVWRLITHFVVSAPYVGLAASLKVRHRQVASLRDLAVVGYHSLCRKTGLRAMGAGRAVSVRLVRSPTPFFMRLGSTDFHTALEVFEGGEYEAVLAAVKDARVVVDFGSNIGISCLLWRHQWPGCVLVAVEPDADNLRVAEMNLRVFAPAQDGVPTHLIPAAIWSRSGNCELDRSEGAWSYRIDPGRSAGSVPMMTCEQVLSVIPPDSPIDLLKCDIEGAEVELFANAGPWLQRVVHLVVETHAPYDLRQLEADLTRAGVEHVRLAGQEKGGCAVGFYKLRPRE